MQIPFYVNPTNRESDGSIYNWRSALVCLLSFTSLNNNSAILISNLYGLKLVGGWNAILAQILFYRNAYTRSAKRSTVVRSNRQKRTSHRCGDYSLQLNSRYALFLVLSAPFLRGNVRSTTTIRKFTPSCVPHFGNLISYREETEAGWYRGRLVQWNCLGIVYLHVIQSGVKFIVSLFIRTECTSLDTPVIRSFPIL